MNERNAIRRLIRARRRALDDNQRATAAAHLRNHLLALPRFRAARNIAAYLAVQGEISLEPVIGAIWTTRKPVYLPCLRGTRLEFRRYTPATPLSDNRFGIPEPGIEPGAHLGARFLDLVLAPLVAFDESGGRLGTGGGFYDRTFAFLRHRRHWRRPLLIGVAYEFQCLPAVPVAAWDVPLDGVVTEAGIRLFRR